MTYQLKIAASNKMGMSSYTATVELVIPGGAVEALL